MSVLRRAGAAVGVLLVGLVMLVLVGAASTTACEPGLSTGLGSRSVSVGTWNVCAHACSGWSARSEDAVPVLSAGPDVLAVQEGGWGRSYRSPTFKAAKSAEYANAHRKGPFIGRYIFYRPGKFELVSSGGRSLGGDHGISWAKLRVRADGRVFVVADVHLVNGSSAASDSARGRQIREAVSTVAAKFPGDVIVWAGDFNSNSSRARDTPAEALRAAGYVNSLRVASTNQNAKVNSAHSGGRTPKIRRAGHHVDQVWVSDGTTVASWSQRVDADESGDRYARPFITDHNMITATVDVSGGTATGATASTSGSYDDEQVENAAIIAAAGEALGVPARGQAIAIMTAIEESGLRVLDHGDSAGPDSRGLFQQRANGAWGSYADRMNPQISAANFYRALLKVAGWADLEPTVAAHTVQRNADPRHYEPYWDDAQALLASVGGASDAGCVLEAGYSIPINGVVHPIAAGYAFVDRGNYGASGSRWKAAHTGEDYSAACGVPVVAAHDGVIQIDTTQAWAGPWLVKVSTGAGQLTTWYGHMQKVDVKAGDRVQVGDRIGEVGTLGNSTGCHLHFEVHPRGGGYNEDQIDPRQWLQSVLSGRATSA